MPDRRGSGRRIAVILGGFALLAGVVGIGYTLVVARRGGTVGPVHGTVAAIGESSTLDELAKAAAVSDTRLLAELTRRLSDKPDAPREAFTEDEGAGWLKVLTGMRKGFLGFKRPGRVVLVAAACRILDGFAIEPAASQWSETLAPIHDLLTAAMSDSDPNLRATALNEVSRLWVWLPSRSMTPAEETALVRWKENLYRPVVRSLGNRDPQTLIAAIACLGALPVDNAAAPALAYLDNPIPEVRKQTLASFAQRNFLLTDDMLLTLLHDPDVRVQKEAHRILEQDRHLQPEQIKLGGLIFSPKPQQRMSVIPLLKGRNDVDPAIWLIQLSRDNEEMVRLSAIEAMGPLKSTSVKRRLVEMARSDASPVVRQAAGKLLTPTAENTAALPPLPGSASLNPKAN